jgi:glycosyltransferase involved in cell wall biosynthesis
MMQTSDISVIIPCYNTERYLADAIESILAQEIQPLEILVIDDGSTDESTAVARRFSDRIRFYQQPNNGAPAARNRGIELSTGSLLAFLDADDLWTPCKLGIQLKTLAEHPELDLVLGKVTQFISPDVDSQNSPTLRAELETMPAYLIGAMLIRRKSFIKVGLLNENLQLGEYIDWFNRAKTIGLKYRVLEEVVLERRIHTSNQGIYKRSHMKDYISVLKAALDRKREADH